MRPVEWVVGMKLMGNIITDVSFFLNENIENKDGRNFLRKERRVRGEFTMSCKGLPMYYGLGYYQR